MEGAAYASVASDNTIAFTLQPLIKRGAAFVAESRLGGFEHATSISARRTTRGISNSTRTTQN